MRSLPGGVHVGWTTALEYDGRRLMQIVPCPSDHPDCSPKGNFRLLLEVGWTLSQEFIDFESGLLILCTTSVDPATWTDTGFGSRLVPSEQYVVDPSAGTILAPEQWRARFDYTTTTTRSSDGAFELITRRVPCPDQNGDIVEEALLEVATGERLSTGSRQAFCEDPPDDLLSSMLRGRLEAAERQRILDAKLDLQTYAAREAAALDRRGDVVLNYSGPKGDWQLRRSDQGLGYALFAEPPTSEVQRFASIEQFWAFLNPSGREYLQHRATPGGRSGVLAACVVGSGNALRRAGDSSYAELRRAIEWDNAVWSEEIHPGQQLQFCPHCGAEVRFVPRYPTYLCAECCGREIVDERGRQVSFGNVGMSGGLRVQYLENGKITHDDCSLSCCVCFIEGKRYLASEARFGGVVICKAIA